MIVLLEDDHAAICARRVSIADRMLVRLRESRLDRELARGASPESSVALALHAERVIRCAERTDLARNLRRLLEVSAAPRTPLRPGALLCRERVLAARNETEALAERLLAAGPVSVRGVARLRVLLSDGSGPLYRRRGGADLRAELSDALHALDPLAS